MPWESSTFLYSPNRPSGGMVKPPTPWMGSAIRHATSRAAPAVSRCSRSAVQAAMYSSSVIRAKPGSSRSVPCR